MIAALEFNRVLDLVVIPMRASEDELYSVKLNVRLHLDTSDFPINMRMIGISLCQLVLFDEVNSINRCQYGMDMPRTDLRGLLPLDSI